MVTVEIEKGTGLRFINIQIKTKNILNKKVFCKVLGRYRKFHERWSVLFLTNSI